MDAEAAVGVHRSLPLLRQTRVARLHPPSRFGGEASHRPGPVHLHGHRRPPARLRPADDHRGEDRPQHAAGPIQRGGADDVREPANRHHERAARDERIGAGEDRAEHAPLGEAQVEEAAPRPAEIEDPVPVQVPLLGVKPPVPVAVIE